MKIMKRREHRKKRIRRLPVHVYLAYLLVCTFLLTGVSFSRYISSSSGSDNARAAKGLVTVTCAGSGNTVELKPVSGDGTVSEDFLFKVTNGDSEVAIRYDVVIRLDQSLPEGVTMELDGRSCSGNSGVEYRFADLGMFEAGKPETYEHTLRFTGDFGTYQTAGDQTYKVTISILSEQID